MGRIEWTKVIMCPKDNEIMNVDDCCACRHYKGIDRNYDAVECDLAID